VSSHDRRALSRQNGHACAGDREELSRAIEAVGGHPRVDILPGRDHFILDIYDRRDIYEWLMQQKREIQ
jgi:hypothetical protein